MKNKLSTKKLEYLVENVENLADFLLFKVEFQLFQHVHCGKC